MVSLKRTYELRCETEAEVKKVIEDFKVKAANNGASVVSWSSVYKEKKSKGEVIDQCYLVKIVIGINSIWDLEPNDVWDEGDC